MSTFLEVSPETSPRAPNGVPQCRQMAYRCLVSSASSSWPWSGKTQVDCCFSPSWSGARRRRRPSAGRLGCVWFRSTKPLSGTGRPNMAGVRLCLGSSAPNGARHQLIQGHPLLVGLLLQKHQSAWLDLDRHRDSVQIVCHFLCSWWLLSLTVLLG